MKTKELFSYKVEPSGHVIRYRRVESGTCFHEMTPEPVVDRLEDARLNHYRIRIFLGNPETGRDWGEENEVTGYVERSCGTIQVPLLIANRRSIGGGSMLDECIIKIMVGRRTVYEHPKYHCGKFAITTGIFHGFKAMVFKDGEHIASFKTLRKAEKYVAFIKGERHTKGGK